MILLSGHSLTHARRIPLDGLSLSLKERESTANMTPADMTGISLDSWFLDDTEPGKGIVWRVTGIQNAYAVDTPTVRLEHVISTLKDRILFGSYEPADISGGDTVTVRQAISWVLSRQSDWKLGRCEFESASPFSFDGETLFDAIGKVTDTLDGAWWDLDTSSYPFVLNIIQKPAAAVCEMRPGRNLSAITKTIDKSGMYTRFYPIGADDLHISGEYISKNENLYGVIDHVEVDQEIQSEAELRAWATERLNRHAEPTVSVTAEGVELAEATGESLDRLTLGRVCRIPLQEFGTIIEERIVAKEYPDKLRQPENVRITLSNQQSDRDVLHMLADEIKNGAGQRGRGGRSSSRQSKEDHAWIEDTESHVALCAVGIIGKDADGNPNWARLSRLEVNEGGIYEEVKTAQNDIVTNSAAIRVNEKAIQQEVLDRSNQGTELSGKIGVQADRIDQEVQVRKDEDVKLDARITTEATQIKNQVSNMDSRLSGQIAVTDRTASMSVGRVKYSTVRHYSNRSSFPATGTAGVLYYADDTGKAYLYIPGTASYELAAVDEYGNANYIKSGEIAISINESGNTEAKLDAEVIYVGRNTKQTLAGLELPTWMNTTTGLIAEKATIVDLNALKARVGTLETDYLKTRDLSSEIGKITGVLKVAHLQAQSYTWTPSSGEVKALTAAYDTVEKTVSGNDITLKFTKINGSSDSVTFSKATSLSGTWSGSIYTVTADPQNVTRKIGFDATADEYLTIYGKSGEYLYTDDKGQIVEGYLYKPVAIGTVNTGGAPTEHATADLLVDATTVYSRGQSSGWDAISSPSVTYTDLGATTLGNVSGKASISNKTDGTTRSTSISLSLSKTTYTPNPSVGAKNCVVVKTSGGTVVGRIETDAGYDAGYVAGWNAARSKVTRDGNTIYRPKARTAADGSGTRQTENEQAFVANYTASSHSNDRKASAGGYYTIGTTGSHNNLTGSSSTGSYGQTFIPKNNVTAGVYIYVKPSVSGGDNYTPSSFNWTDS